MSYKRGKAERDLSLDTKNSGEDETERNEQDDKGEEGKEEEAEAPEVEEEVDVFFNRKDSGGHYVHDEHEFTYKSSETNLMGRIDETTCIFKTINSQAHQRRENAFRFKGDIKYLNTVIGEERNAVKSLSHPGEPSKYTYHEEEFRFKGNPKLLTEAMQKHKKNVEEKSKKKGNGKTGK